MNKINLEINKQDKVLNNNIQIKNKGKPNINNKKKINNIHNKLNEKF